ncbi:hypothetical protein PAPYR_6041 [Paratrimastix pyriformis]|uniref:Uncharacterized protein n=1 Tax=Paratrimastix pyriformis TaxID=342808 RepID=A0ABQ8UIJ2_9EUKA|nr:hypothetical protein PAPYR_6041 [Paratrimastix pyriformis]
MDYAPSLTPLCSVGWWTGWADCAHCEYRPSCEWKMTLNDVAPLPVQEPEGRLSPGMIPQNTSGGGGLRLGELSGPGSGGDVSRIMSLNKQRQKDIEEFERKRKMIADNAKPGNILLDEKFTAHRSGEEEILKVNTIGLKTHEDFKKTRENLERLEAERMRKQEMEKEEALERKRRAREQVAPMRKLSFSFDEGDGCEDEEAESEAAVTPAPAATSTTTTTTTTPAAATEAVPPAVATTTTTTTTGERVSTPPPHSGGELVDASKRPRRGMGKDPTVNTEFLPDKERELKEKEERAKLAEQYKKEQAKIKGACRVTASPATPPDLPTDA